MFATDIFGIDLEDDLDTIIEQLCASSHTRVPVYRGSINDVMGLLHPAQRQPLSSHPRAYESRPHAGNAYEPYFVQENTPLHTQLLNFKDLAARALVVDEYGEVKGIVTLEDILEEIVGEFTSDLAARIPEIHPQDDGSYIIEGTALLRDINRSLKWELPTAGPRTLSEL